ncbi:hypothetical protein BU25DRAFT_107441 [Macroventuria anomochaeta]|uniref:Uncharacterized protein n=1 Tax=Macroventuria anomochaeta TaxID=301207 RepID=A0ACB6RVV6_9PLEO|nr:uncharacterized protein BU25DRAFT_107441 [Macroventuria anomochaeta]KAF2626026.1 hypothetical protein BU25DRAFT_107441 [Macroventuria anomochaeta]
MDYGRQGRLTFRSFLSSLVPCSKLRYFNIDLVVCHVFGPDLDALKDLFLYDQEPRFHGLEKTANIDEAPTDNNAFLQFAFSGMRQIAPWVMIEERLEANNVYGIRKGADKRKLGKLFVNIEYPPLPRQSAGDKIMDFETWKLWSDTTAFKLRITE